MRVETDPDSLSFISFSVSPALCKLRPCFLEVQIVMKGSKSQDYTHRRMLGLRAGVLTGKEGLQEGVGPREDAGTAPPPSA